MRLKLKSTAFPRTLTLSLDDDRFQLEDAITALNSKNITAIEISDWNGSKLTKKIADFKALKEIRFTRCHALKIFPAILASCPNMEDIAFIDCADFSSLKGLSACASCRAVHICRCDSFEEFDENLSLLQNLVALDVSSSPNLRFIEIGKLPKSLKILDIHGCSSVSFDEDALSQTHILSPKIQDLSRLDAGLEPAPSSNIINDLKNAAHARFNAGLDDG